MILPFSGKGQRCWTGWNALAGVPNQELPLPCMTTWGPSVYSQQRMCLEWSESKPELHFTHRHKEYLFHVLTVVENQGKTDFCFVWAFTKSCSSFGRIRSLMAMTLVVFVTKTTYLCWSASAAVRFPHGRIWLLPAGSCYSRIKPLHIETHLMLS